MREITCEQVSDGHPDKLADQISDAIVTDCLKHDKSSRCAVETLVKNEFIVTAGEVASKWSYDTEKLIFSVFEKVGPYKIDYENVKIINLIKEQSPEIAQDVKRGFPGDQGVVYGYATNETPEMLPIPFVLATDFLARLKTAQDMMLKADAKAQVTFDYEAMKINTFVCSVQHREGFRVKDFKEVITWLMKDVATSRGFDIDFVRILNPGGPFTRGGSFADCGVTGRKIACDTYGGIGRIGDAAISGKDPTKIDRFGIYIARKIAKDLVALGYCDRCEVQIAYSMGFKHPHSFNIDTFGTAHTGKQQIDEFVKRYDLSPRGVAKALNLYEVDYNESSAYGQFWNQNMPWEQIG